MHPRRALALAAAAGFGLGGGGFAVAVAPGTSVASGASGASGATRTAAPKVQLDLVGCSEASRRGKPPIGSCTYVLTDGRRFSCPLSFSNHPQTPGSLERAPRCRPLKPIPIPRAWRPVFARLYAAQACLARHGLKAQGGPILQAPRPRRTPIGELVVIKGRPIVFIGFYATRAAARRADSAITKNARRFGGQVDRHESVILGWTKPPSPSLTATINRCGL